MDRVSGSVDTGPWSGMPTSCRCFFFGSPPSLIGGTMPERAVRVKSCRTGQRLGGVT